MTAPPPGLHPLRAVARSLALAAALVAPLVAGCSDGTDDRHASRPDDPPPASDPGPAPGDVPGEQAGAVASIEEREWVLDPGDSSTAGPEGATVTLRVALGEVVGSGGCTTYQGPVDTDGVDFDAGPFTRTVSSCRPQDQADEDAYVDALGRTEEVRVDDRRMVLLGPDGVRLSFTTETPVDALSEATLVGRWRVETIGDPGAGGVPPVEGAEALLSFEGGGTLGGVLGCNTLSARWALEGERLTFPEAEATEARCTEPEGVADQETAILAALVATTGFDYAGGDGLALLDGGGNTTMTLRRVS